MDETIPEDQVADFSRVSPPVCRYMHHVFFSIKCGGCRAMHVLTPYRLY